MTALLILLSSAAAAGAASLFVYWAMAGARSSYADGARRSEGYLVDRNEAPEPGSLFALANGLGVTFLPLNERLRDRDQLGVALALARWEATLVRADLRSKLAPEHFLGICEIAALAGAFVGMLLAAVAGMGLVAAVLLGAPCGAAVGFAVPVFMLNSAAADRVARIEKRLPFAIEFMLLAMEATAALPEALAVYRDLMPGDPLAHEFDVVLKDVGRGASQIDALKAMGDRLGSDSVSAFLLAVNIGLDTGQPIKDVLQTQADATRLRRYQNAEEVAKTAGTKAIVPLFIVVIGILMLVLGPIAIKTIQGGLW